MLALCDLLLQNGRLDYNKILTPYKLYKKSPRTTLLCSHIFSGPQGSWSVHVCCLHLKMEFRSCARGHQWLGIIQYC